MPSLTFLPGRPVVPNRRARAAGRWSAIVALVVVGLVGNALFVEGALAVRAATGGITVADSNGGRPGDDALAAAVDPFGGAPSPADARPAPADTGPGAHPGAQPSVQYEEALAHEHDRNTFTPGTRVVVPFTPRRGDHWAVDGAAPRSLPSGNATGRDMARSPQGSRWATRAPGDLAAPPPGDGQGAMVRPVDAPAAFAGRAIPAALVGESSSGSPATQQSAPIMSSQTNGLHRQVFGFLPYWTLSDSATTLNYDLLSTIAYFGVGADANGNLMKRNPDGSTTVGWSGWTSSQLTSVITAAHRRGCRVVLTVQAFAWTTTQAARQSALLASAGARLSLARQVAAAVRDRGADGVNLDFEPIVSGRADEFTAFVRTLRAELDRIHKGYQLTFDTTGFIGNYPIEAATAPGGADAIFIMGYDYRTSDASTAGSIDPLAGPTYTLADTIQAYTARVPGSKLILGLPYYGRAWSTTTNAVRAPNQSGAKFGYSTSVTYGTAASLSKMYGRTWDPTESTAWFAYRRQNCTTTYGCVTSWRQVYFDDPQSLKARYDLVIRSGLRGAGLWALGYDARRSEMWGTISLKFLHDTTPPEAGVDVLRSQALDAGFVVSWRAVDDSRIASYDVQVSVDGGPWTAWIGPTKATSEVFLGTDGHSYAFRVRATDSVGNAGAWDVASLYDATPSLAVGGFGRVRSDGVAMRVAPDTSALAVATLAAGATLAIIGGPASADGYTWYQVSGPLTSWNSVDWTRSGVWVAVRNATTLFVSAAVAPNSTKVNAGLTGLTFGDAGAGSLGPGPTAWPLRVFSPNGDGSKDLLRFRWTNQVAFDALALRIYRRDGVLVGQRALGNRAAGPQAFDWDGSLTGVGAVPDGSYMVQLVGTVGATTYTAPSARPVTPAQLDLYGIALDRVAPIVTSASASGSRLSPNGDGRFDTVAVALAARNGTTWDFSAAPQTGGVVGPAVRTLAGLGSSARVVWDGRTDAGTPSPDGTYQLTMRIGDPAGNHAVRSWVVVLDTHPAAVTLSAPPAFSPDGDGVADSATLRWTATEPIAGQVLVLSGSSVVRSWSVRAATSGAVAWNGRDRAGRVVHDGRYSIRVDGLDGAGNRSIQAGTVIVDRTVGFLHWTRVMFDPQDADGLLPTSQVQFKLARRATSTLTVLDAAGKVVRIAWTNRAFGPGTHAWTWDGRTSTGAWAPPGSYIAVLTATGSLGTTTLRRAVFAGAFLLSPSPATLRAGQRLTISFRSVEPLATRPTVIFRQTGRSAVVRTASFVSAGLYRVTFTVGPGAGPATVSISARDVAGHVNGATLALTVL